MTKSAKASAPESNRSQKIERLTDAVNHLADEARLLRDVLDETRENLSWIARNGIPGRQDEHAQLVRMASDPHSPDANERLEIRSSTVGQSGSSEFSPDAFDALVSQIAEAVTVIGQEQVNLLLTALDDVPAKLVAAIKSPTVPLQPSKKTGALEPSSPPLPATSLTPSEPGRLF
jgi:hypothetical protein